MKKTISIILVIALTLLALVGCGNGGTETPQNGGPAAEGETYTLRLGHVTQVSHPFHIGAEKFASLVEEKSDGRITIEIFPARALGDDRELLEQVMNNTLDIGVISGPVFSAYTPIIDTLQLPFLLNTYEKELAALTSPEMQDLLDSLDKFNLKGLAVFEGGMRHLASAKGPIKTPADMKGLKLRATQSELVLDILTALGANPTPMAYGEVYTGLQTKVIDGEEINLTSVSAEKHYEVLTDISEVGLFPFPGICVTNVALFDSLSEEDQQILIDASYEAMVELLGEMPQIDEEAAANIEANSDVVILSDVDVAPFEALVQDIYVEYEAKDPVIKAFVDMAKEL
jgi:tripartite ATP-independent transporter DctP family solute receptor